MSKLNREMYFTFHQLQKLRSASTVLRPRVLMVLVQTRCLQFRRAPIQTLNPDGTTQYEHQSNRRKRKTSRQKFTDDKDPPLLVVNQSTNDLVSHHSIEGREANCKSASSILGHLGFAKVKRFNGWEKNTKSMRILTDEFIKRKAKKASEVSNDGFVLESKRLISEAILCGLTPSKIVVSRLEMFNGLPMDKIKNKDSVELLMVPYNTLSQWSDLETSPGTMAVFSKSDAYELSKISHEVNNIIPMTLILDNVRSPDNMGSLLRIAAGAGCRRVITTKGCVDVWNPKVVRAGAGAHFHVPLSLFEEWTTILNHFRDSEINSTFLLDHHESDREEFPAPETGRYIRFNELSLQDGQRSATVLDLQKKCSSYICQSEDGTLEDVSYEDRSLLDASASVALRSLPYTKVRPDDFLPVDNSETSEEVVIILGGETTGISREAHLFALRNNGQRVFVPMSNSIDSLNVASVASIVLFHLRHLISR